MNLCYGLLGAGILILIYGLWVIFSELRAGDRKTLKLKEARDSLEAENEGLPPAGIEHL